MCGNGGNGVVCSGSYVNEVVSICKHVVDIHRQTVSTLGGHRGSFCCRRRLCVLMNEGGLRTKLGHPQAATLLWSSLSTKSTAPSTRTSCVMRPQVPRWSSKHDCNLVLRMVARRVTTVSQSGVHRATAAFCHSRSASSPSILSHWMLCCQNFQFPGQSQQQCMYWVSQRPLKMHFSRHAGLCLCSAACQSRLSTIIISHHAASARHELTACRALCMRQPGLPADVQRLHGLEWLSRGH